MNTGIFKYFDGKQDVMGDPLTISRKLWACVGPELNQRFDDLWAVISPEQADDAGVVVKEEEPNYALQSAAWDVLIPAIRYAFDMAPFDKTSGEGATETHCREALWAWFDFNADEKKSTDSLPTSSQSTAAA